MAKRKITLLDGAMGTNLINMGMPPGICVENWILGHRDAVVSLQKKYIEAGAKIIYAPTFGANPVTLKKYGTVDCEEINAELVALSKEAASGSGTLVAGDLSTTGLMPLPYGEAVYSDYFDAFRTQAVALDKAGVDLFVIETSSLIFEVCAAVDAVRSVSGKPVFVTYTVGKNGRTFVGDDIACCLVSLQDRGISAFGINCSEGEESVLNALKRIAPLSRVPLIAKPNAGVPDSAGGSGGFSSSPETFAEWGKKLIEAGASYIGGCCGTTPEHIKALDKMIPETGYEAPETGTEDENEYACSATEIFRVERDAELPESIPCDGELMFNMPSAGEAAFCRVKIASPDDAQYLADACMTLDLPLMISGDYASIEAGIKNYAGRCVTDPESDITEEEKNRLKALYGCITL
ncbi:MAG: homocysteine S-methyltransferase family protein [Clostridia bacterium]|nr:homocysteine S-methyltransferase family protein [Clostridia bacterium]